METQPLAGVSDRKGDKEPDVRFTYANERTYLAWNRTALALIATGAAATQLLPSSTRPGRGDCLGSRSSLSAHFGTLALSVAAFVLAFV